MEPDDPAGAGCPWSHRCSVAAYAPSAVAALLAGADGFGSPRLARLYAPRAAYAFRLADALKEPRLADRDARLLSALLSKLAQRGLPAPCSLTVERHVLAKGARAGVLDFDERSDSGQFVFRCRPRIPHLGRLLRACLHPELTVEPADGALLVDNYRLMCVGPQREFFERLVARLFDERLALLVTPNRRVLSMLQFSRTRPATFDERVDFAVEGSSDNGERVIRLAVDLDGGPGDAGAPEMRRARAEALEAEGWTVVHAARPRSPEADVALDLLEQAVRAILPAALVSAADDLRVLPDDQRGAVEDLIGLPLAEAQITAFAAEALFRFRSAELLLANPLHLDLGPVVTAVTDAIEAFRAIHSLPDPGRLRLAFTGEFADAAYFALPSNDGWDALGQDVASTIVPSVAAAGYVPPLSGAGARPVGPAPDASAGAREAALRYLLQNVFRKVEFRPGQVEIIERALALQPAVGLLPTAAGKSLCYQLATFAQPGVTLIVAPLAALMQDQQDNLRAFGIHRTTAILNAMLMREDDEGPPLRQPEIEAGEHLFVFVAPERLQMPDFRDYIQAMTAYVPVTYGVIDEAHCVSEWGHDFRLSYLNVAPLLGQYCRHQDQRPSLLALTGTASRNVVVDILRELDIQDPGALVRARSFDRGELDFEVYQVPAHERLAFLAGKLRSVLDEFGWQPGQPGDVPSGLVFTYLTDDDRIGTEAVAADIGRRLRLPVPAFSDLPPREFRDGRQAWEEEKAHVQRRFKRNELPVLVCTAGFGMGIDKPTIRFTVHTMLPRSLEEFYQQAGRAGRDRRRARCLILFADDQPRLADRLLDTEQTPLEEIADRSQPAFAPAGSDAVRNARSQAGTFVGREVEERALAFVARNVLAPSVAATTPDAGPVSVPYLAIPVELLAGGPVARPTYEFRISTLERILYRLLIVGAVSDYMNDFSKRRFLAVVGTPTPEHMIDSLEQYLRRYTTEGEGRFYLPSEGLHTYDEAAVACGTALIRYVYATIEKRRRRAIGQMLQAARDGVSRGPAVFREQLVAYVEESEFTARVAALRQTPNPDEWLAALDEVRGRDSLTQLLGACRRGLEEDPTHPGLLMLAGTCRLAIVGPEAGAQDLCNGCAALQRYSADPAARVATIGRLIAHVERLAPSCGEAALAAVFDGDPSHEMARFCYGRAAQDSPLHHAAIVVLAGRLAAALKRRRDTHERAGAEN